ncbi:MAG TPA: acyl-ACP--UDP-N-acetylglucosamine O-acyltransferase [Vicinamibacteria bacterium]|nr:acyl-ACP--UDP-N-acetylglucosamine O-acyltransferase [Vicinamibacteria bacterium]
MSVHATAIVSPDACVGRDVSIGPFAVVEAGATIGDRCEIRAHAVVKRHTTLGVGNRVHEGAVLGGEPQDVSFRERESRLVVGDRNVFREGVTLHRSTKEGGATAVGSDCFLMACAHVAHDCRLGSGVVIANNVMLAGHVEVGDRAFLGGGAGVHQFCRVGRLAMVGGMAKVVQDCLPFVITDGHPARARGLNVVGLRRAGVTAAPARALKEACRLLLRSGLHLEPALESMAALADPLVDEMIAFVRASKRGFAHAHRADGGEP